MDIEVGDWVTKSYWGRDYEVLAVRSPWWLKVENSRGDDVWVEVTSSLVVTRKANPLAWDPSKHVSYSAIRKMTERVNYPNANYPCEAIAVLLLINLVRDMGLKWAGKQQQQQEGPLLGLATTGQLLEELRARCTVNGSIDYRTVDG